VIVDEAKVTYLKIKYRRIPQVTALITLGFSRQKGPLLSGSRYFRKVKKTFVLNSRFRQSGRATHEIESFVFFMFQEVPT